MPLSKDVKDVKDAKYVTDVKDASHYTITTQLYHDNCETIQALTVVDFSRTNDNAMDTMTLQQCGVSPQYIHVTLSTLQVGKKGCVV